MARARIVSDEEIAEMYTLIDETTGQWAMTTSAILAELGIHQPQLYMALDRLGIERREARPQHSRRSMTHRKYNLSDETVRRVAIDYMVKNRTAKEIAEELQLSYSTVLKMLRDASVQVIPGRRARKYSQVHKEITQMLLNDADKSLLEIAAETGTDIAVVHREAKKLAKFKKLFRETRWGKTEALLEELMHRIRDEWGEETGPQTYQGRLPGF